MIGVYGMASRKRRSRTSGISLTIEKDIREFKEQVYQIVFDIVDSRTYFNGLDAGKIATVTSEAFESIAKKRLTE